MPRIRRALLRAVLLAPLAAASGLGLAGCETTGLFEGNPENQEPADRDYQRTEPIALESFDLLWLRTRATVEAEGYAIDDERTSFGRRELVTRWITNLATTRFEGIRRRAHVEFESVGPGDAGPWIVKCAILRQRNADIDAPTNVSEAQWERSGTDTSRTALLLWKIRAGLVDDAPAK